MKAGIRVDLSKSTAEMQKARDHMVSTGNNIRKDRKRNYEVLSFTL